MTTKVCHRCGKEQSISEYRFGCETKDKYSNQCRSCLNEMQRERRSRFNNIITKRYEKTIRGYLMRTYRNMESRVTGIQWQKAHLYLGKQLLDRESFYNWSLQDKSFNDLFIKWTNAGYPMKLSPSIERKDSNRGYVLDNMEWITHSENSRRGNLSRKKQRV